MPDPSVEQTSPADVGTSTSEFKLSVIAGAAGAILAGLVATFAGLKEAMPDVGWIASAVVILGALTTALLPLLKYVAGRGQVKVALANVQAAELLSIGSRMLPASTATIPQLSTDELKAMLAKREAAPPTSF